MLGQLFVLIIRVYQWTLSPLFGNVCRFEPSCSNYTIECIRLHGSFLGVWLGFRRVLRCHPFNPGGFDPPPRCSRRGSPTGLPTVMPLVAEPHRVSADEPSLTHRSEVC
jgi:putative membrane protein insertion efficiency factor